MPTNTAAWLLVRQTPLVVKSAPYTQPRAGEIVVKNHAVAINPVDWGIQQLGTLIFRWLKFPLILGSDLAGEVVEVGQGVTRFSAGDRVLALALSTDPKRNTAAEGAFQNYTVILAHMAAPIPDALPYENACVLPLALSTAACGLFQKDHLALQYPSMNPTPTGKTLLIWGGSTSVGSNAIQLAVAAGYEVFTTASPQNFEYVKHLGASQVFDYHDANAVKTIINAFDGKTSAGALAIGAGSAQACADIIHACKGNKFVSLASGNQSFALPAHLPPGVSLPLLSLLVRSVQANITMGMKFRRRGIGHKMIFGSSLMGNEVGKVIFEDFLPQALAHGKYIAAPDPVIVGTGLDYIQTGLDVQRQGVPVKKVVIALPE
jgi:NADPH:quinone reductase-like Zn-dependent oxidoreductase